MSDTNAQDTTTAPGGGARRDGALELFATCPRGFERLLAGELSNLGAKSIRALNGQVAFAGSLEDAYRACLWSRLASRVMLVLAHVNAHDSDTLHASLVGLPWEDHLALTATFAVDAHGSNANLRNTQFVGLRAKDAICDRLQAKLGGRPNVDARRPDVTVVVRLHGNRLTCAIDLSGSPLFRRSAARRDLADGLGGLRADYAAALLAAGSWHRCCRRGTPTLVAGYAGSGTVLVEAAGIALDQAPGLTRHHWGFERWLGHDAEAWERLVAEANERAEQGLKRASEVSLVALDPRRGAASAARQALVAAGYRAVTLSALAATDRIAGALAATGRPEAASVMATLDLSWLGEHEEAREVAALGLGAGLADALPTGASLVVLSERSSVEAALGLSPVSEVDVLLGRDEARVRTFVAGQTAVPADGAATAAAAATAAQGGNAGAAQPANGAANPEAAGQRKGPGHATNPAAPEGPTPRASITLKDGTTVPVLVAASDQFAARLAKVAKLRAKWARREGITCYRVYDADLPDYAVAIDLYHASEEARGRDKGATWAVVQEYAAPKSVDAEVAHRRLLDVLAIVPPVLGVPAGNVSLRVRRRAKGGSQYANEGAGRGDQRRSWLSLAPGAHLVDEGGLVFEVNLAERLDTGLFLDHRDVRAEVREMAKDTLGSKRFLNLFAYTGTATCYAADGGAKHTTTVDLSGTYLDWAERNMARNGFTGPEHEYVQADCVSWVSEMRRTRNRWDLVFCDPPTFSNSKRMGRDVFDVQRDHAELLIGISRILTANGLCLFSCNLRGFVPDVEKLERYGVQIKDVTEGTIPEDFARNAKIHHCYLVRRTPR